MTERRRPDPSRRRVTPARVGLSTGALAAVLIGSSVAATADPQPTFPSQQEVNRAKGAVSSKSAQVAAIDARYAASMQTLQRVREEAAAKAEEYNGALYHLQQAKATARRATRVAEQARRRAQAASVLLRRYAAQMYQETGTLSGLEPYVDAAGIQDFIDRTTALQVVGEVRDQRLMDALAASGTASEASRNAARAKAQQAAAAEAADQARAAAQAEADRAATEASRISAEQQAMAAELARLRHTSVQVEQARQDGLRAAEQARQAAAAAAEQARLAAARAKAARDAAARRAAQRAAQEAAQAAAEQRRRAQAAQAAADQGGAPTASSPARASSPTSTRAPTSSAPRTTAGRTSTTTARRTTTRTTTTRSTTTSPPPSPASGVSAVLAYARAQIGKPYLWGGAGPDAFDCSGLTMMAWRQAGVYLTHYTGAQWAETRRVALADLRPGDLVFYGSSGPTSHHVGLYVGNGQMIEAPYTGAYVRYASIYRWDLLPYGGRP